MKVVIDSREVTPGSLFVPLVGKVQDGHAYIPQALEKGASSIFINKSEFTEKESYYTELKKKYPKTSFIPVDNTLYALQDAARDYVAKFSSLIKIGITGSSGKTTTKEIAKAVLSQKYRVIANEGNLNTETGLPLSVFNISPEHEVGIFEMGMNRRGEIAELASVLIPHYGIITNIGTAHIGFIGSIEGIAEEKKQIFSQFTSANVGFVPEDDLFADFLTAGVAGTIIRYGDAAKIGVSNIESQGIAGTRFDYEGKSVLLTLPGSYNLQNAFAVIALARYMGLTADEIRCGLESVQTLFGRSQVLSGDLTIMQDCYNANPSSMEESLDFFCSLKPRGRKIIVLGDMLELGKAAHNLHAQTVMRALKQMRKTDLLILLGEEMCDGYAVLEERAVAGMNVELFDAFTDADIACAGAVIKEFAKKGDIVLLKGSRGIRLERLVPIIQPLGKEESHGK